MGNSKNFITRLYIHEGFLKETNQKEIIRTTPNSTPLSDLAKLSLRDQIVVLIKENPSISKRRMSEILGVSMCALKKELAAMSKEHVAGFVGFSRNGKWVVY